jgi:hypothetical protein
MTMRERCLSLIVAVLVVSAPVRSGTPQKALSATALLGNLRVEILKVEQTELVGDSFTGPSISRQFGRVYLNIRNIGDFRVCGTLMPSIEEYKDSELQYTQKLKSGFTYNPKIKNLAPRAEVSGYYDFKPSPQKRDYVLILRERDGTQRCNKITNAERSGSGTYTVRLPLPKIRKIEASANLSRVKALFFEWVAVHVVAVLLPETGLVVVQEFEAADPLHAFPGIEVGEDQSNRVAVIGRQRFAVVFQGEQSRGTHQIRERDVGSVALLGLDHDVRGAGPDTDALHQFGERHAFPAHVEAAPAGDAMHVRCNFSHGQMRKFVPGETQRLFDQSGYTKIPGFGIEARDGADVKDGPLQGEGLVGREASGFAHQAFLAFAFGEIFKHGNDPESLDFLRRG